MTDAAPNPDGPRAARSPVMADVARLAGVSHQTVSRVVNGHPSIRPATRERVEDAIRQLGYRPNSVARALVTRRSGTIGVIATNGGLWGPSTVHRTVQAAARESGYFVSSVNLPDVTSEDLAAAVEHLRDHSVEGIVMIVANDEALDIARNQETGGVPVVVVEGDLSRAPWTVGVDQVAGAADGHRAPAGPRAHPDHARRRTPALGGGTRPARRAGGPRSTTRACGPLEPLLGDWTAASGYAAGRVLAQQHDVTAVFVANDHMAIGVLRALFEAGRRVPEDLSVVGFDDIPESGFLIPPLTTVRQDFNAVGRLAIDTLQVAMRPETADHADLGLASRRGRLIDPELVLRASTASDRRERGRDDAGRTGPERDRYVVGVDFGTLSGRALVVRVADGAELGSASHDYTHARARPRAPRRHAAAARLGAAGAQDYRDVLRIAVPEAVAAAGVDPADVIGIATDFTACTMVPTLDDGTPLCEVDGFADRPHAYVKLWKHHAAQAQADRINALAAAARRDLAAPLRRADLLGVGVRQGPRSSSRRTPSSTQRMEHWVEAVGLDRVAAVRDATCATPAPPATRASSRTAHYPGTDFLEELAPGVRRASSSDKLEHPIGAAGGPRRRPHRGGGRPGPVCPRASPSRSATSTRT